MWLSTGKKLAPTHILMFLASSAQVCDGLSYTVPLSWAHRAGSPLNSNTDIFIILPATTTKKTIYWNLQKPSSHLDGEEITT